MKSRKIELHISQVQRVVDNSRSDFPTKKQEAYDQLITLFEAVKQSDFSTFDEGDLLITKDILNRIFHSIEHLDYKDESELSVELTKTLNLVLTDWFENPDEYFIAISFNNRLYNFYIDALSESDRILVNGDCLRLFNVPYNQSVIQISKSKYLANDFLGCVPVYHELGHFIDLNYQIIFSIYRDMSYRPDLEQYTPTEKKMERVIHCNHLREFFADIFAAQYLGFSSVEILKYIAYKNLSSFEHPSTDKRISVVRTFTEGTGSIELVAIVEKLKEQTLKRTKGRELRNRFNISYESPFINNNPIDLSSEKKEIHGLFSLGWDYLILGDYIEEDNSDPTIRCQRINDIIKDSINLSLE